jgi:hypothetical protein
MERLERTAPGIVIPEYQQQADSLHHIITIPSHAENNVTLFPVANRFSVAAGPRQACSKPTSNTYLMLSMYLYDTLTLTKNASR